MIDYCKLANGFMMPRQCKPVRVCVYVCVCVCAHGIGFVWMMKWLHMGTKEECPVCMCVGACLRWCSTLLSRLFADLNKPKLIHLQTFFTINQIQQKRISFYESIIRLTSHQLQRVSGKLSFFFFFFFNLKAVRCVPVQNFKKKQKKLKK